MHDETELIKMFAREVLNDNWTVCKEFQSNWNNESVKEQVNRLKTIKQKITIVQDLKYSENEWW